jgi:hypothetical protein
MTESSIEAMLEGLSWAEQMELEEQLADAQGRGAIEPINSAHYPIVKKKD